MYKGSVSGVLFALIVKKFPSVNFFYTSAAIDAMDKYQVWLTDVLTFNQIFSNS